MLDLVCNIPEDMVGKYIGEIRKVVANHPSEPMVIGTFLETLTHNGEWGLAFEIAQTHLEMVPTTTRMRTTWLFSQQQCCQAEFEFLIAQGKVDEALSVAKTWDAALAEINQIRE
ncbi:hypothetical protein [Undibacterium pigrum]|uniref:Uncharacterized protein n=1 Tax=Undibacterium pigrum TaxID=401470 RepID=A0A318JBV6_9BURK|nr:hypothetical protein [Undibacterium pigrum]PXX44277.1 hypothetical protein DFR42_103547 [Undibacterium pigrum]